MVAQIEDVITHYGDVVAQLEMSQLAYRCVSLFRYVLARLEMCQLVQRCVSSFRDVLARLEMCQLFCMIENFS